MFGMFGFSFILALIVLYCTTQLGLSDKHAYAISAAFNALSFATSVPSGWIAERYLGFRFGLILGVCLCMVGIALIAITSFIWVTIGLGIFISGTGMFVTCLYVLLGNLYHKEDPKREDGFVWAYIAMNFGAFLATGLSGTLANLMGYSEVFLLGALFAVMLLPLYAIHRRNPDYKIQPLVIPDTYKKWVGTLLTFAVVIATILFVHYASLCNALLLILGVCSLGYIVKFALTKKGLVKKKLLVFVLLTSFSVVFWTLYMLEPSALLIFTQRNVNRHFLRFIIPAANLTALNPFFIISLGPLLNLLWPYLKRYNIDLLTPSKFAIGLLSMGIGYLILVPAIHHANILGFTSLSWIVVSYFFQTVGELLVGPVGFAMVGKLVPPDKIGVMMGIWQLGTGMAGAMSQFFANYTSTSHSTSINPLITNPQFAHAFGTFGWLAIGIGIVALIVAPMCQRIMTTQSEQHVT